MSGHGHHDAGADPHAGHDEHHHETTSDDFPPDEPRSPGWLPLLGGALFLAGIFGFVMLGSDDKAAADAGSAAPAPAPVASAIRAPGNPALRPSLPRPGSALPPGHEQFVKRPAP